MKRRGRARKRPLTRSGVFRAFSPAPLYMLYFLPCHLGDKPAFICFLCPLSRRFTCGTFVFQVSRFLRQFSNSLQNTVSKILTISLLLTTGNDFFLFLNSKICRCLFAFFPFSRFSPQTYYTTSFQIPSVPLPILFRHKRCTEPLLWRTVSFLRIPPLLRLLFRQAMVA